MKKLFSIFAIAAMLIVSSCGNRQSQTVDPAPAEDTVLVETADSTVAADTTVVPVAE